MNLRSAASSLCSSREPNHSSVDVFVDRLFDCAVALDLIKPSEEDPLFGLQNQRL